MRVADETIDVAVGSHRNSPLWKNKAMTWADITAKCGRTHRTAETVAQYHAATKQRQAEIKDIGGFVGGYLTAGVRKKKNVQYKQLVTLDADFAEPGLWDDFMTFYGCAGLVYSTHKHTPEKPRLRLVIPLNMPVTAQEYEPIARKIADQLGIEQFDPTTYDVNRLMYWPSTPSDGEFVFEYNDGEFLDKESVLSSYRNWRDASEWPTSSQEGELIKHAMKKQGDPLEKPGIIGAFCRQYPIEDAMEKFLPGVYEATDVTNRYTFIGGSTAAGMVTYEDKFAYSHHSTDPISEKLVNAFDLVRLHKFGAMDDGRSDNTPINKLPSFVEMERLAMSDPGVRKLVTEERLKKAGMDFLIPIEVDEVEDTEWLGKLEVDKKGTPLSTIKNVVVILENDPRLKGRLGLNLFERREEAIADLPWRKRDFDTRYLTDADDANLRNYFESNYGISAANKIIDGQTIVFNNNGFHPVKEYLNSLPEWDHEERIDRLMVEYFGADDTEFNRVTIRKMLVASVKRIFEPGCKFDYVHVMVGPQGLKKSTFLDKLGGQWFTDGFGDVEKKKEVIETIQGVWLVEIGELAGMKKASVENIKQFITSRVDRFRVAYGRRVENFPRQCVFFATTNNRDFLKDPTGNRRFWPVDVHPEKATKDVSDLTERDQIWAEALYLYRTGEKVWLDEDQEELAKIEQSRHTEVDDRAETIMNFLEMPLPADWDDKSIYDRREYLAMESDPLRAIGTVERTRVCAAEIWCECLGGMRKEMTSFNVKFIHNLLQNSNEWRPSRHGKLKFPNYGVCTAYEKVKKLSIANY